jgi:hypothetical protein
MDQNQAVTLLTYIAAIDRRPFDPDADGPLWADLLDDIPYEFAKAAVRAHYREQSRWITPAEVRRRALAMRVDASRRPPPPTPEAVPDADPDDEPRYRQALAQGRWRDPDTRPRPVGQLLASYAAGTVIPAEDAPPGPLAVPCPLRSCRAQVGEPCRTMFGRERAAHPVRGRELG